MGSKELRSQACVGSASLGGKVGGEALGDEEGEDGVEGVGGRRG